MCRHIFDNTPFSGDGAACEAMANISMKPVRAAFRDSEAHYPPMRQLRVETDHQTIGCVPMVSSIGARYFHILHRLLRTTWRSAGLGLGARAIGRVIGKEQ